jgi:hypothetical protein
MRGNQYLSMMNSEESFQFKFNFHRNRLTDVVNHQEWTDYIDSYYESFGDFISNAFVFSTTPEGHEYWDYIRRSKRDGIEFVPKTKPFMRVLQGVLDNINKPKGENLDDILKELNISKPKIKMTKLTLDVNPFLCKIEVSARLDGVEERGEIHYNPLDYPCEYYVTLGDHTFKAYIDYIDTFHVEIFDEDSIAIPSKIKITK